MPKRRGRIPDDPVIAAMRAVLGLNEEERARFDALMEIVPDAVDAELQRRLPSCDTEYERKEDNATPTEAEQ